MCFRYRCVESFQSKVALHTSVELPQFPESNRRRRRSEVFSRNFPIRQYSQSMARVNRRCFPVESAAAVELMDRFLRQLVVVEGLECVAETNRYSLELQLSEFHQPELVCAEVAELVRACFYPDRQFIHAPPQADSLECDEDVE